MTSRNDLCLAVALLAPWPATTAVGQDAARARETPAVLQVPTDCPTIQDAIDAAPDGGTVLIAPGVYHEDLRIDGKSVRLTSHFLTTQDRRFIANTILDGTRPGEATDGEEDDDERRSEAAIFIGDAAGPGTTVIGLTIRDADDGIACHARVNILFNRFVNNVDAIDYEGGGGACCYNEFVANDDDAVDYDGPCDGVCAHNEIRDNDDDGIEIRLHPYQGETLRLVIRDNLIAGNGEDGIQIIDYPEMSDRVIRIERNYLIGNAMAGIGFMADGNTVEDYSGAAVPEPVVIANNTIARSEYGVSGGGNARLVNNVLVSHRAAALSRVAGDSRLSHNLFWDNRALAEHCNPPVADPIEVDPLLDENWRPRPGSPCRDAGVVQISLDDAQCVIPAEFTGPRPDLGAAETE